MCQKVSIINNKQTEAVCLCVCVHMYVFLLTSCIAIKQEGVLELEVQVFGDRLGKVLHAESVHNSETMSGRRQPEIHRMSHMSYCSKVISCAMVNYKDRWTKK